MKTSLPNEDESYWARHVESHQLSGLTRSDYCRQHQVNYDRFGYWLKKYRLNSLPKKLIPIKLKSTLSIQPSALLCTLKLDHERTLNIYDMSALSFILEKIS